ncbi:MAG: heavy-metal-associated domain-containing protein [Bacteroidetes bacterium]|nr:heavy-metal-associated domain-containing protein [Bacteroidota bacterium]
MNFNLIPAFLGLMLTCTSLSAQVVTDTITVAGDCEHCKERIEQAVDLPGVKYASWSAETQKLIIEYKSNKISIQQISDALVAAGHDTQFKLTADDKYQSLPGCCHYERLSPEKSDTIKNQ